jgi:hypothetical protein
VASANKLIRPNDLPFVLVGNTEGITNKQQKNERKFPKSHHIEDGLSNGEYFRKADFERSFLKKKLHLNLPSGYLASSQSFRTGLGKIIVKKTAHLKAHGLTEIGTATFSSREEWIGSFRVGPWLL